MGGAGGGGRGQNGIAREGAPRDAPAGRPAGFRPVQCHPGGVSRVLQWGRSRPARQPAQHVHSRELSVGGLGGIPRDEAPRRRARGQSGAARRLGLGRPFEDAVSRARAELARRAQGEDDFYHRSGENEMETGAGARGRAAPSTGRPSIQGRRGVPPRPKAAGCRFYVGKLLFNNR